MPAQPVLTQSRKTRFTSLRCPAITKHKFHITVMWSSSTANTRRHVRHCNKLIKLSVVSRFEWKLYPQVSCNFSVKSSKLVFFIDILKINSYNIKPIKGSSQTKYLSNLLSFHSKNCLFYLYKFGKDTNVIITPKAKFYGSFENSSL